MRPLESKKTDRKVSQDTLLNLGTHFDLSAEAWPELCTRIEQILSSEQPLFASDPTIEKKAQHIDGQIIARRGEIHSLGNASTQHFEEVDVDRLQQINPPSVPSTSP